MAMKAYETSTTVGDQGQVRVNGVPFAPGTEVEVTISPKVRAAPHPTPPADRSARPAAGLRWEGNVLVHHGEGVAASVAELRDERLNRLGEGRPG
jgi:hypothetical protein